MRKSSPKKAKRKDQEPKRIAVVEENADNIYSIKFVLQSIGYLVNSFSSRDFSHSPLMEFSPHLIIVDMMIPYGGGYEIIRALRRSSVKKVPILAITAEAMEGSEADVRKAGGKDTLSKPYSVAQLRRKLKKWLR
jgi:CheY-like chemotaxis protein